MFLNNRIDSLIVNAGYARMSQSTITICSIVRNCNKNLVRNLPCIDILRSHFRDSNVVIFENDSIDGTKKTLESWRNGNNGIYIECADFGTSTIAKSSQDKANRYFSRYRIEKMADYRNKYLEKIDSLNIKTDYILVIDLDIISFSIDGIAHSFGLSEYWDVVASNGYSFNSLGQKRYHDSYALVELGYESIPQTEDKIKELQKKWSYMRIGQPLMQVFSAHGGMSIYKYYSISNARYQVVDNDNERVGVRCEHYSLCQGIRQNGYSRIFINPNMTLCYQTIDFGILKRYVMRKLFRIKD